MKKSLLMLAAFLLMNVSALAFADSVIVTQTSKWKSVPINVDSDKHTYTVVGTVPADSSDYYYSYSGYRCFKEKRDIVGVNAMMLKASISGGSDVYCYPES